MSSQGQALIDILVRVSGIDTSEAQLRNFFTTLSTSATAFATTINAAAGSITALTTATNDLATSSRAGAAGLTNMSRSSQSMAAAANSAAAGLRNVNAQVSHGIALARLGVAAQEKYNYSIGAIDAARIGGNISAREAERARRNAIKLRNSEILQEARERAGRSSRPLKEHLRGFSDRLVAQMERRTLSLTQATRMYRRELLSLDAQGVYTNQATRARHLEMGIGRITRAQRRLNAEVNAQRVARGTDIANPAVAAGRQLRTDIRDVSAAYRTGAISSGQFRNSIDQLNRSFRAQHTMLGRFSNSLKEMGRSMYSMSHQIRNAGRQMMMFGALTLAALSPAIIQNAKFEQSVSNVLAVINDSGPSSVLIENLSSQFLHLGETSEFTAIQVATAAKELALAGFNAQEVQKSIAGVVDLASATGVALDDAARIAANITRAFQLTADSFEIVSDKLVAIANNANTTVEALAESFKYVSPIAASLGQSIDDVGAALGVMANAGTKGSRAGTGLSRAFSEMIEKADEFDEVLRRAGSSFEMVDPEKVGFGQAIKELERLYKLGRLTTRDLSDLFDQRSFRAIITLINQGGNAFDELKDKIEDASGLAEKTKEARLDTLYGDYLKFTSALTSFFIELGETTNSTFRDILVSLRLWIVSLKESIDQNAEWVQSIIKAVTAIGIAITALGTFVSSIGGVLSIGAGLIAMFTMLGGPIGAFVAILGVAAAAMIYFKTQAMLLTASDVRQAIIGVARNFMEVDEAVRKVNKQLDKNQEKLSLLSRLPSLKPVELNNIIEGGGFSIGDTNQIKSTLNDQRKVIAAEMQKTSALIGTNAILFHEVYADPVSALRSLWGGGPMAETRDRITELEARLQALGEKNDKVVEAMKRLNEQRKELTNGLNILKMDYGQLTAESERLVQAIKDQENVVASQAELAAAGDEEAKYRLDTEEKLLNIMRQKKVTADDMLAADSRKLPIINALGKAQEAILAAREAGASDSEIARLELREKKSLENLKDITAQINDEVNASDLLNTRMEALAEIEKKRAEAKMSERDKAIAGIEEEKQAEKEALDMALESLKARQELTKAQMVNAEGAELAGLKEMLEGGPQIKGINDQIAEMLVKLGLVDQTYQDLAASSNKAFDDALVQKMDQIDLTLAKQNGNIAEQIRLTEKLAQAQILKDAEAIEASERADYINKRQQALAGEMANKSADMVDQSNLALAKKTENLQEELRLTEKLGKERINKNAAEIADANLRAEYIRSETALLNAELDDLRDTKAKQQADNLKELESNAGLLLRKRVENHDKIRDALAGQVKNLQDAHMLNIYLLRLEKSREAAKERARKKAISGAFSLKSAMERGGSQRTLSERFSKSAALYDTARQMGVSSLALTPVAGMLQAGLPTAAPSVGAAKQMPGPGNINSNNTTLTIAPGAIVVNGDDATVAEKIMEQIINAFGGKLPKKP